MELGLILPYEGSLSFVEALELTQRAEALGFDSMWMPEQTYNLDLWQFTNERKVAFQPVLVRESAGDSERHGSNQNRYH